LAVAVNCCVALTAIDGDAGLTAIDATTGGVTVNVIAALVTLPEVAVIFVVPAATPVANPLLPIVATVLVPLAHVNVRPEITFPFASLAVAVNCCVANTAIDGEAGVTAIDATTGGVTVNVIAALVTLPEVAVIFVVPTATPVATPLLLIVATLLVPLAHVNVRPVITFPFASFAVAVNCWVANTATDFEAGVTVMVATTAVFLETSKDCAGRVDSATQVRIVKARKKLVRAPCFCKHPRTQ